MVNCGENVSGLFKSESVLFQFAEKEVKAIYLTLIERSESRAIAFKELVSVNEHLCIIAVLPPLSFSPRTRRPLHHARVAFVL